ncbi:MAG: hypothetical protein HQK87_04230 [Nitrospinae bacterium]|nr:hypothetical protein [Nitrospinota bacterium]
MRSLTLATVALAVMVGAAHASGGGLQLAEEWTWRLDGSRIFNALVIFAGVAYLIKKYLLPMLAARTQEIADRRAALERAKADADARLAEVRTKLDEVAKEAERIRNEARAEAETLKNAVVAQAAEEARALVAKAAAQIDLETEQARERLRREAMAAAVDMAEAIIKKSFGPDDQKRLVEGYLTKLESMN